MKLNYNELTDEQINSEAKQRDIPTDGVSRNDLIAHLELDDEASASDPREQDANGVDNKAVATSDGQTTRSVPIDLDEYEGQYRLVKDSFPGEVFGLKIVDKEDVRHGKTHHAKSPLRFGDYTPEEFRAQFDKIS